MSMPESTDQFTGCVADSSSRGAGYPEAVGYFRPLTSDDVSDDCPIDDRWLWLEWWETPKHRGDGGATVAWREGDAIFVPSDGSCGVDQYFSAGPRGRWVLAENSRALVVNIPEGEGKWTLAVLM